MKPETLRILLIEDNPGDVRLLKEHLTGAATLGIAKSVFEWATTDRLAHALKLIETNHFDVALLDLSLPDSHGLDTFVRLQQIVPHLPIIVLSGLDDSGVAIDAVRKGAQDYLVKGDVSASLLMRSIHYAIERKRGEENHRRLNQTLQDVDKLKSDFLSHVSSELRTPIEMIRQGVSQCLNSVSGVTESQQRDMLRDTLNHINRLNQLVTDLMDVSGIESGNLNKRRIAVRLQDWVKNICEGYQSQAREKGIQLSYTVPESMKRVCLDSDQIQQIFNKFIGNSLRFTPSGGSISIEVRDDAGFIECIVSDTGTGITEENLSKLFIKSELLGSLESPFFPESGFSLSLCKRLIEKHGGKITVKSKPGKGTTFRFTLAKAPFPTILVVESEMKEIEIIKEFLAEECYIILDASNGKSGIFEAVEKQPSLIILDMKLSDMSGYEFIGRLKQDSRTRSIPLLGIRLMAADKDRQADADAHSAFPVITKPVEQSILREKIHELLVK